MQPTSNTLSLGLTIFFCILYAIIFFISLYVLACKEKIYPNGLFPKIILKMYSFTMLSGAFEVFVLSSGYITGDVYNYVTPLQYGCAAVAVLGNINYLNMYWYHMLTWMAVVYATEEKQIRRKKLKHLRVPFCIANSLILSAIKIADVLVATNKYYVFGLFSQIYNIIIASSSVVLTITYLVNWRKLVALLRASKLSSDEKAHRTAKLTKVLSILTVCLELYVAYIVLVISLLAEYHKFPIQYEIWQFVLDVLPRCIANVTIVYYFSPFQMYHQKSQPEKPKSSYGGGSRSIVVVISADPQDDKGNTQLEQYTTNNFFQKEDINRSTDLLNKTSFPV